MAKAKLSSMKQQLEEKKPEKKKRVSTIEHPPRGERSDFLKITLTIPGDLLIELRSLGMKRKVAGLKDTDTSALVREALIEFLHKHKED